MNDTQDSPEISSIMPQKQKTNVFLKQKNSNKAATVINIRRAETPTKNVVARKESLRMESKVVKDPLHTQIPWELSGQQCWNTPTWPNPGDEGVSPIHCGWTKATRFRIHQIIESSPHRTHIARYSLIYRKWQTLAVSGLNFCSMALSFSRLYVLVSIEPSIGFQRLG